MLLINSIVLLSILGHLYILSTNSNQKEVLYGLNMVVLFIVWSVNENLNLPSAFAIVASIICIFRPQHKHCWALISIFSLAIFVLFLLNKPKILEGHIFGVQGKIWEADSTGEDILNVNSSDISTGTIGDTTVNGVRLNTTTKNSTNISPSDISDGDDDDASIDDNEDKIDLSGNTFSGTSTDTDPCKDMKGYCQSKPRDDTGKIQQPATYCIGQTGACVWDVSNNQCIDKDYKVSGNTYLSDEDKTTSTYTYLDYYNAGKCSSTDDEDDSDTTNTCDGSNCIPATWVDSSDNFSRIWGGDCKQPDDWCVNKTSDDIYCPAYICDPGTKDCYESTCAGDYNTITKEFKCGTRKINVNCNNGLINTTYSAYNADDSTSGNTSGSGTTNGTTNDSSTTNGSSTNGSTTNGSSTNGSTTNGSTTNGSTTNGNSTNGSSTNGSSTSSSSTSTNIHKTEPKKIKKKKKKK